MTDLKSLVSSMLSSENHRIAAVVVLTNNSKTVLGINELIPVKTRFTAMTSSSKVWNKLKEKDVECRLLEDSLSALGLSVLNNLHDIILQALGEGQFNNGERILAVLAEPIYGVLVFDTSSLNSNRLAMVSNEHGIEIDVLNKVMELARYIGSRGREGHAVGAIFAVGSIPKLRRYSTSLVLNPFKGHSDARRNVLDLNNHETLAEFAWLDGAILFSSKGVASDAGRYIQIPAGVVSKPGEGGRHMAARAISQLAHCVSICVSSTGVISLYSTGKLRYSVRLS